MATRHASVRAGFRQRVRLGPDPARLHRFSAAGPALVTMAAICPTRRHPRALLPPRHDLRRHPLAIPVLIARSTAARTVRSGTPENAARLPARLLNLPRASRRSPPERPRPLAPRRPAPPRAACQETVLFGRMVRSWPPPTRPPVPAPPPVSTRHPRPHARSSMTAHSPNL